MRTRNETDQATGTLGGGGGPAPRPAAAPRAWRHLWALVALVTLALGPPAQATLVVPLAEDALIEDADAIVLGVVTAIQGGYDPRRATVVTDITVRLAEVLKGARAGDTLTVRQLGGSVGDLHAWVAGSPRFTLGEKVLLFLRADQAGQLHVAHLYQGKFTVVVEDATGDEHAVRATPAEVHVVPNTTPGRSPSAGPEETHRLADLAARIRRHVAQPQHSARPPRPPLVFTPASAPDTTLGSLQAAFSFMGPARWFEPDTNDPVVMTLNALGEPRAPTNGFDQVRQAFQAWSTVAGSAFRYHDGGFTTAGGYQKDGVNAVSFGDPLNDMDPPVGCSGTLAVGGFFFTGSQIRTVNGTTFWRILEGDLVFNSGWAGCGFYETFANFAEVATHELGHVLGLDHSADPTATMYPYAHFDGRGAALGPDDVAGLQTIYPGVPLTVTKAGTGSGTVSSTPSGIDCGSTCGASFASATSVTLTAAPAAGSTFTGWSGAGCAGTGPCLVTMSAAQSVTATFTEAQPLTLTSLTASPTAPQLIGTPVTFTVTATGGLAPREYRWHVYNGSSWSVGQDWSTSPTYTRTFGSAGNYQVQVWARSSGTYTDTPETWGGVSYTIVP